MTIEVITRLREAGSFANRTRATKQSTMRQRSSKYVVMDAAYLKALARGSATLDIFSTLSRVIFAGSQSLVKSLSLLPSATTIT